MKLFRKTDAAAEAAWFARRRDPKIAQHTEDAFQTWLAAQPQNAVDYGQCELAWERTLELADDPQIREAVRAAEARVRREGSAHPAAGYGRPRWAAAAAAVAVISGASVFALRHFNAPVYETEIGEQRDVRLPDGSHVTLNTATRMIVRYGAARRDVELICGEALFDVRRDAARPFEVLSGGGIARAVGTRFTVEHTSGRTTVSVLEGIVALLPRARDADDGGAAANKYLLPALESGQSAAFTPDGRLAGTAPADIRRIQAWQDRKLDFESQPLGAAIAEVNRYASRPLVLGRPELAELKISGVFHIASLDGFTFALQRSFGLRVVDDGEELLVLPKTEDGPAR